MWVGHSCPTKPRRKVGLFSCASRRRANGFSHAENEPLCTLSFRAKKIIRFANNLHNRGICFSHARQCGGRFFVALYGRLTNQCRAPASERCHGKSPAERRVFWASSCRGTLGILWTVSTPRCECAATELFQAGSVAQGFVYRSYQLWVARMDPKPRSPAHARVPRNPSIGCGSCHGVLGAPLVRGHAFGRGLALRLWDMTPC